jgi:hypothetical protein
MDMDPERMRMVSEALMKAKEAFGEDVWNDLTPKMRLFLVKRELEFMEEGHEEIPDMFTLLELTRKELEGVLELEKRAKLMVLEAKATV